MQVQEPMPLPAETDEVLDAVLDDDAVVQERFDLRELLIGSAEHKLCSG